jgi:hypothetical protein
VKVPGAILQLNQHLFDLSYDCSWLLDAKDAVFKTCSGHTRSETSRGTALLTPSDQTHSTVFVIVLHPDFGALLLSRNDPGILI